jgi:Cof subfamily protein (haloacid dehalogenase superfamily)
MIGGGVALVISDVDGTLVTSDKVLTARTRAAVASLAEHGIAFTIISSRPPFGMRMLIEPLALRLPFAAFNGGVLATPDLAILERRRIGRDACRQALADLGFCEVDVWLFTEDRWILRNPEGAYVPLEMRTVQTPPVVVESFEPYLDQALKLVGVSADFDRLVRCEARVQAALKDQATVSRSQSYYLDIMPPKVDKGVAVAELMRRCAVDPAAVVTIGDMDNDVPMFRRSGFSIAMGNGSAAAKGAAHVVTRSNNEDGFAEAVERLILPRVVPG